MQAAFIDYSLTDPQAGMEWIFNTLIGTEQLPNIDVARAIGGAQAWFDAETAKEAARLAAIDAATTKG